MFVLFLKYPDRIVVYTVCMDIGNMKNRNILVPDNIL